MDNKITEQSVKDKLGIKNWKDLSKDKVIELVNIFETIPNLDKDVFLKIIGNVPEVISGFKEVANLYKDEISQSSKASSETKNYYTNVSNRLFDLLDKENITDEDKKQIYSLISEVNSYVKQIDSDEKQSSNQSKKVLGGLAIAFITVVGALLGVKAKVKS